MDGIFKKSTPAKVLNIIEMLLGAVGAPARIAYGYFFENMRGEKLLITAIICGSVGLILFLYGLASFLLNRNAYLHLDEHGMDARFLWGSKIKCAYSEIAFCNCSATTLALRMKNGKNYTIFGLANSIEICDRIKTETEKEITDDKTINEVGHEIMQTTKRINKNLAFTVGGLVAMFALIALLVILTGGRDIKDFTPTDKIFMICFAVAEVALLIITFVFAGKAGKDNTYIRHKKVQYGEYIIKKAPLPSGNVLKCYIDLLTQTRVIIYGFPNSENVYYIYQFVGKNFALMSTDSSEIFPSMKDLSAEFNNFDGYIDFDPTDIKQ